MREIKLRDSGSNANTKIYFEIRVAALLPRLHTEPFTKGPPLRNYNSTPGVHNSSLKYKHLDTRGKAQSLTQSKEEIKLSDSMITNSLL